MENEQPKSNGPGSIQPVPQKADYAERPSSPTNKSNSKQPSQNGTIPGERHSEGSLPENDKETVGTP